MRTLTCLIIVLTAIGYFFNPIQSYQEWRNEIIFHDDIKAYAPRNFDPDDASPANQELLAFPREMEGADRIDIYIVPDAVQVITQIRSKKDRSHFTNHSREYEIFLLQNLPYEFYSAHMLNMEIIESIQKSIESIIINIPDEVPTIFVEGIAEKEFEIYEKWIEGQIVFTQIDYEIDRLENGIPWEQINNPDLKLKLSKIEKKALLREKYRDELRYCAIDILAKLQKIHVKPAELGKVIKDLVLFASIHKSLEDHPGAISRLYDYREDAVLANLAKEDMTICFVEFDGDYAWGGIESCGSAYENRKRKSLRDNLAKWNKKHPDHKFSLIEITPTFYDILVD